MQGFFQEKAALFGYQVLVNNVLFLKQEGILLTGLPQKNWMRSVTSFHVSPKLAATDILLHGKKLRSNSSSKYSLHQRTWASVEPNWASGYPHPKLCSSVRSHWEDNTYNTVTICTLLSLHMMLRHLKETRKKCNILPSWNQLDIPPEKEPLIFH